MKSKRNQFENVAPRGPNFWTRLGPADRYFNPLGWPGRLLRKTISQIRCRIVGLRGFRQLHQSRRHILFISIDQRLQIKL